jgi:hypothetical protein
MLARDAAACQSMRLALQWNLQTFSRMEPHAFKASVIKAFVRRQFRMSLNDFGISSRKLISIKF